MRFQISAGTGYTLCGPTTFLFSLRCALPHGQRLEKETLSFQPEFPCDEFTIGDSGNRVTRVRAEGDGPMDVRYDAVVDRQETLVDTAVLAKHGPHDLAPEAIPFLFPSRYCPSDKLRARAFELFGTLEGAHAIVSGIREWVNANIRYVIGASSEQSSAMQTLESGQGVCRDFAHLAITFCRAMNIPARYVSCYAHRLEPQDFHAVFEAFIGGTWCVFDATGLAPLNGLVRICTGHDAADTSVCTIFGAPLVSQMRVSCDCLDEAFAPLFHEDLRKMGKALSIP